MILAGGSVGDLSWMTPELASKFNTVDSFDDHSRIKAHFSEVDEAARRGGNVSIVSAGWDPGLLSLIRLFGSAFMPHSVVNTLWGEGVSQGHSEAIRRISGVIDAVQFTLPKGEYVKRAERGESFSSHLAHERLCYIAAESGREKEIAREVKNMPNYFLGYDTKIVFTDKETVALLKNRTAHRGRVIAAARPLGARNSAFVESTFTFGERENLGAPCDVMDFSLSMASNPAFTANILLAAARAAVHLSTEGAIGAKTFFDIPPRLFCATPPDDRL